MACFNTSHEIPRENKNEPEPVGKEMRIDEYWCASGTAGVWRRSVALHMLGTGREDNYHFRSEGGVGGVASSP